MTVDRRTLIALTGALLAGAAGCTSDDRGTPEVGDETAGNDGEFEQLESSDFPRLEPVTDPDIDLDLFAEQVRGNVAFSFDVLSQLRNDRPEENVFFSPYSISVALAMTYAGARGETATEMADALQYELENDLHTVFGALEDEFERRNEDGEALRAPDGERTKSASDGEEVENPQDEGDEDDLGFQLSSANAVWTDDGFLLADDYRDVLEAYYGAGDHVVDFTDSPEEARQEINEWVEERTNDRIENLLPQGSIDASTRLVLTNAVYFLAAWENDFTHDETEPAPFVGLDGTETEVELMHQTAQFQYAEVDGHQLVELPYANGETSMIVVLPAEGEFESFEESFTVDRLATMLEETSQTQVDLALPKFGIESEFSLVEAMQELGMERAFGGGAEFDDMVEGGGNGLFIDDIRHKSFVEVDEEGTEAAAATAVTVFFSAPPDDAEMTVDRPFLFYVRDRPTETPLFVGRVVDAETLQDD
ncbi:serpin family protein [Natronobacterium texcoconense]|uniref:Serpin B n=1 Tax=Natronobacterium texcoconense TaxID=1095778 RepID=A0A1H0Z1T1_NATTX|nr:serpin family protein [Natronobacterium texcoconense]SDQ21091.1 serpin B [Natronobacterium texcoconense]